MNIELITISSVASILYEIVIIIENKHKSLKERILYDNNFIEYCSVFVYPFIAIFLSYILWWHDEYAKFNDLNMLLAANVGVSCSLLIKKPLDLIK